MAKPNRMTSHRIRSFFAVVGLLLLGVQDHHGQFLEGRTMTLRWLFGGMEVLGHTVSFAVDSTPGGVEVPDWGDLGGYSIDVFDTDDTHASIIISCYESVGFGNSVPNIWQFADLSQALPDFGVLCVDSSNWPWLYQERFVVSPDAIDVEVGGAYGHPGDFVRLDLTRGVAPSLSVELLAPTRVAISWPTNASHYSLESASSLPTSDWSTVTNKPVIVGQSFKLALDATNMHRVFRLHKQ